ncbi:oxidoreductase [Curtobacterium sp. MMLR14_014]|uniref:Gfo/Idh/MocA family oxidoreductase n=1 Tax=unclassified Curtobacterium TaxID=257496 RepID=UPI0008F90BB2|nr:MULTISPECIES: Gfo/Idh/MocA family oxidoreductase [unclassified Curtobacterium]OII36183.1 oxidoreductase [Curtobacterium sp. MMLR14_002]OII43902.1 oxidoreductase [Curtobacterium sp. MMLR14_014]
MTEPTNPLRLAVVGAGVIGRHHATVAVHHPDLQVVALVDAVPEAATSAADAIEAMGVARPITTSTIEEAIDQTDIDVVAICSPSGMHVQLAEAALAAGKHVVIEKPLDTTMPRARQIAALAAAARDRGLVTSVISQHRFDPASAAVARAAHDGGFGTVTSGLASVAWYRSQGYYDSGDWRGTWALDGGGAVMNQGVHTVDLLVWALGRPVEISAQTGLLAHDRIEVEDTAVATVRFAGGALGVVHCTTAAYPGLSARYAVYGTHGSAIVDDDRLAYFHIAPDTATLESASTTSNATAVAGAVDQKDQVVPPEHVVGGPAEPDHFAAGHARQYTDIVDAIRQGREPGVTVDAALVSLATVRGLYVSATLGHPVRIDDVIEGKYDDVVPVVGTPATASATEGATR